MICNRQNINFKSDLQFNHVQKVSMYGEFLITHQQGDKKAKTSVTSLLIVKASDQWSKSTHTTSIY